MARTLAAIDPGGRLARLHTLTVERETHVPQMQLSGTETLRIRAPDRRSLVSDIPGYDRVTETLDGTRGWHLSRVVGIRPMDTREQEKTRLDLQWTLTADARRLCDRLEFETGGEDADAGAWRVTGRPRPEFPSIASIRWVIDRKTFLPVEMEIMGKDGWTDRTRFNGYRTFEGLVLPAEYERTDFGTACRVRVRSVRLDAPIEDAAFKRPEVDFQ